MPTVKTVSVHYERKLNLGDFNSATVGIQLWADVEPGEDLNVAMASLWGMAKENVKVQLAPLDQRIRAEVKNVFLGLPVTIQEATKPATNASSAARIIHGAPFFPLRFLDRRLILFR